MSSEKPTIFSLDDFQVHLSDDLRYRLASQYEALYRHENDAAAEASQHVSRILYAMKTAPRVTTCRINHILSDTQDVVKGLNEVLMAWKRSHDEQSTKHSPPDELEQRAMTVTIHPMLSDIVCVGSGEDASMTAKSSTTCKYRNPQSKSTSTQKQIFANWTRRGQKGWPMTHRVVICDRFCGEAVLRGSDIFVRGVICADSGIHNDEVVAVYADVSVGPSVPRGLLLEKYAGSCVFLGLGRTSCNRADMFKLARGVAIHMSCNGQDRAGPLLPPLHGVMPEKFMLQNLPSVLVAHTLAPQEGEVILDMCSAPGGKTTHLASLVRNNATIVACDKSRKKVVGARELFERMGATCIAPLPLDSTSCVIRDSDASWKSVSEVLSSASTSENDGLLTVTGFFPESFDRILLDPPCSALGLRPKLKIETKKWASIEKHAKYQRSFVREAVSLLKQGGTMTYSTCTISSPENEEIVKHVLDEYPCMKLVPIKSKLGLIGLPGTGLNDSERSMVRRFDPSDEAADTMGFFVAKFYKERAT